jgi:hypothetical protein
VAEELLAIERSMAARASPTVPRDPRAGVHLKRADCRAEERHAGDQEDVESFPSFLRKLSPGRLSSV